MSSHTDETSNDSYNKIVNSDNLWLIITNVMDQKNSIDKLHENLISIEATWREREKKTSVRTMEKRARQVQNKKCYAISSTALISTLAINRLIKRREKGGARSLHPSYYSSFHLLFSPMIVDTIPRSMRPR